MYFLCLEILDLLRESRCARHARFIVWRVQRLLQLDNAPFDRIAHFLCLPACVAENNDPFVLAQLPAQSLGIEFNLFVGLFQSITTVYQLLASRGEDPLGAGLKE